MTQKFPVILKKLLLERQISIAFFAREVGSHQPLISAIINGRRRPPISALGDWADYLKLEGKEKDSFILTGLASHCTENVKDVLHSYCTEEKK